MLSHLRFIAPLFAVALATIAPAFGQTAYYSLEGDFATVGDELDVFFNLQRSVDSDEVLRFETFANSGGTNAAGDLIDGGGIDSIIELFDSSDASRGINDDHSFPDQGRDSLLSWSNVPLLGPAGPAVFLNPDPLTAGGYRLNQSDFDPNAVGPWAIDLQGPADAIALTAVPSIGTTTIDSLKFGTTGVGAAAATVAQSQDPVALLGDLVLAPTGSARYDLTGGSLSVGGATTVNSGGTLHVGVTGGGVFNAGGDVTVDGGAFARGAAGVLNLASGRTLTARNGGQIDIIGFYGVDPGRTVRIESGSTLGTLGGFVRILGEVAVAGTDGAGTPSTWNALNRIDVQGTLNVSAGGLVDSAVGGISPGGTVTVTGASAVGSGARSTWINQGGLDVGENGGATATLNVLAGGRVTSAFVVDVWDGNLLVSGVDPAGNPSTLSFGSGLRLGRFQNATLRIDSGGLVEVGTFASVGRNRSSGAITIDGSDSAGNSSSFRVVGDLNIASSELTQGTMNVTNGGSVASGAAEIARAEGSAVGTVHVRGVDSFGTSSNWSINGNLTLGANANGTFAPASRGTLNVTAGARVTVAQSTFVNNGGVVHVGTASNSGTSSSLAIEGGLVVGAEVGFGDVTPGGALNIAAGGSVTVLGATSLVNAGAITMTGGHFDFATTTLADYQAFNVTGGTLAGNVQVTGTHDATALSQVINNPANNGEVVLQNSGVISGSGFFTGSVANQADGLIIVDNSGPGIIQFSSPNNTNAGLINLRSGQLIFLGGFTNLSGGVVRGSGSLSTSSSTHVNQGTYTFTGAGQITDPFTNDTTGVVNVATLGEVRFITDVVNRGQITTVTDANVFLDDLTGNGVSGQGAVSVGGTLDPGFGVGLMSFGGNLTLGPSATVDIELGGDTGGVEYDRIEVAGEAMLDGGLSFTQLGLFEAAVGDTFDVLTAASITGVFDTVTLPGPGYELVYSSTAVQLVATSALSGDYNNDGTVDAADYSVWRDNLNAPAGTLLNDTAGGVIGVAQYNAWVANYGATVLPPPFPAPEPTAVAMLASLIGLGALGRPLRTRSGSSTAANHE